jgi:hypothetical protein
METDYFSLSGAQTTITLTPNAVTLSIFPTATVYVTSTLVQEETTYEVVASVQTLTLDAAPTTVTSLPEQTVTVVGHTTDSQSQETELTTTDAATAETLPTTPPSPTSTSESTSSRSSRSSRTSTSTTASSETTRGVARESVCLAGDENAKEGGGLFRPTQEQTKTLCTFLLSLSPFFVDELTSLPPRYHGYLCFFPSFLPFLTLLTQPSRRCRRYHDRVEPLGTSVPPLRLQKLYRLHPRKRASRFFPLLLSSVLLTRPLPPQTRPRSSPFWTTSPAVLHRCQCRRRYLYCSSPSSSHALLSFPPSKRTSSSWC